MKKPSQEMVDAFSGWSADDYPPCNCPGHRNIRFVSLTLKRTLIYTCL